MDHQIFTVDQVRVLCGGVLPVHPFDWRFVEHFKLEGDVLQPYRGKEILPGHGILVATFSIGLFSGDEEIRYRKWRQGILPTFPE